MTDFLASAHVALQSTERFTRNSVVPTDDAGVFLVMGTGPRKVPQLSAVAFAPDLWPEEKAKRWLASEGWLTTGFRKGRDAPPPIVVEVAGEDEPFNFDVTHKAEDQRLVFGWLYVCRRKDGSQVVDHSGEIIKIAELEQAAYGYALNSRKAGSMHRRNSDGELVQVGRMIEQVVFTPEKRAAMGVPDGVLPDGLWVGLYIDDDTTWDEIKSGKLKMFSLGGRAIRRALKAISQRRAAASG